MQQQDQSEKKELMEDSEDHSEASRDADENACSSTDGPDEQSITESTLSLDDQARNRPGRTRFDWPALFAVLAVAAFFALTARFNRQPSPSYISAAIFSATGCGLLVTAIHKLRRLPSPGLLEAGLGGFGMAFFQFAVAFTYPSVFTTVTTFPDYSRAFLITWGLIALFAVVLSMAGATIGHLAFAPLRPRPASASEQEAMDEEEEEPEPGDTQDTRPAQSTSTGKDAGTLSPESESAEGKAEEQTEIPNAEGEKETVATSQGEEEEEETVATSQGEEEEEEIAAISQGEEEEEDRQAKTADTQTRRSVLNYAITVLLLGLLPMMAGYVFAAVYDFVMGAINVNQISPALYPTLGLLSGLLPWRLEALINLSSQNGDFIVFTLLWRIPDSILGNPNLFDVQALEMLVFNAAGLALLLITLSRNDARDEQQRQPASRNVFFFLELLYGLILILPANLWLLRGLEGVLQFGSLVAKLPTIQMLNLQLFVLNLLTGPLFCLIIALIVRRQYQLWTSPRTKKGEG